MNIQIPGFSSGDQARGLQNFITDIRNCPSREAEQQRIDKELANIRGKFAGSSSLTPYQVGLCVCLLYICALRWGGRSVGGVGLYGWGTCLCDVAGSYLCPCLLAGLMVTRTHTHTTHVRRQRKKYVWKLVYIFMLGYEVDFGHMEIIALISSGKVRTCIFYVYNVYAPPIDPILKKKQHTHTLPYTTPLSSHPTAVLREVGGLRGRLAADEVGGRDDDAGGQLRAERPHLPQQLLPGMYLFAVYFVYGVCVYM